MKDFTDCICLLDSGFFGLDPHYKIKVRISHPLLRRLDIVFSSVSHTSTFGKFNTKSGVPF